MYNPFLATYLLVLTLVLWPTVVEAHNGAVAIAVPVAGITIDGDFSDWPTEMRRYPILHRKDGVRLKNAEDFQGSFRVGYNATENTLYVAVEVQDESTVIDTTAGSPWTQDGCAVYVEPGHREEDTPPAQYGLWGNTRSVDGTGRTEDVEVAVQREVRGHRYEWRLDMSKVHEGQVYLHPRMAVGFDVALWDKDEDGSGSWMAWGRGKDKEQHSDRLGDVVLLEQGGETGKLQGQVSWEGTEKKVGHGQVRVQSLAAEKLWVQAGTDQQGHYAVEVPEGRYQVGVSGLREKGEDRAIAVQAGQVAEAELVVKLPTGLVQPAGPGRGHWQSVGVAEGLSSLWIRRILQDRVGNLWVAALDGLSRYNGQQWTTFTTQDGLVSNVVGFVLEDRKGSLWFGTFGGLSRYDGQQWTTFTTKDGLASNWVEYMLEDQKGNLWVGSYGGVSRYDGQQWTSFNTGLPNNGVRCIAEDRQGNLWFGGGGGTGFGFGGLSRYDGQTLKVFTTADGLASDNVIDLAVDREGNLWAGTFGGGVSRHDGQQFKNFTTQDGLPSNNVVSILEDREGSLWFGTTDAGVCRYDGQRWTTFTTEDGLAHDHVLSILEDREGSLWFGTFGGSLSRYDEQVKTFTVQDGLAHKGVLAIAEDQKGNLWVANGDWMGGKGVSRYDGQQWTTFTVEDGLADNLVRSILGDRQGKVWFGTDGEGMSRYDGQRFETFTTQDGLAGNWVHAIAEHHEGNLWFGTTDGVNRYDGQQWTTFTVEDGLPSNNVVSILEDREGKLWLGTDGGLSRYDGQRWITFTVEDGLPSNQVNAILPDLEGKLWIGAGHRWARSRGGGLSRYDGQRFEAFTATEGLTNIRVVSLAEDQEGKLWLGTGGGVSRYDGRVSQHLLRQDGLAHDAVNQVLQTRNGDMWIATEGGLTRYRPRPALPPPIHIEDVVADHHYGPAAEIRLSSSQKLLAFEFAGLSFKTRPGQMAYVYQLEGHDPDWRVTHDTRVEYVDLPVGNYTFQVKAVDRDLNYSEQPATVAVEVFYQAIVSPVRLAEVHLQDLFASFYKTYNTQPLGTVQVLNDSPDSVAATLSFFLPDYMRRPSEQPLSLAPNSSQQVEVKALLDEQVLNVKETVPVQAEVSLAVASGDQSFAAQKKQEIILHGRGALTWAPVGKAAAFITPDDPAVSEFARSTLVAFEEQVRGLGKPCRNLLRAMVLFEALKAHGVRYIPDANTPYTKVSADRSVVDHISYPAEVLQQKAGDCDDLTVLYCSLLENAGVSTALVDAPGHIFLLFDTGVSRQEVYKLPIDEKLYLIRGDRVWVPLEVTLVGEGFARAWQAGAEELVKVRAERERVVDTQAAWEMYAPASPVLAEKGSVPSREEMQEGVRGQYAALEELIDGYLARHYLDPLKVNPGDGALWSELARVYVGLGRYDAAIKSAYNRLRQQGGEDATTLNQLGIAHYLKGDLEQAAYFFKKAVDLAPADTGIRRNLDKTVAALGESGEVKGKPPAGLFGTEEIETTEMAKGAKAGQVEVDEDSFYWGE